MHVIITKPIECIIKITLPAFLLLSFAALTWEQPPNGSVMDRKLLQAKPDTNKVKLLNDIAPTYQQNNPEKAMNYAVQALGLSNELRWNKGIAISYRNIGNCYYYKSHPDSAIFFFNKSLHQAEQTTDYGLQGDALYALSFVYADDNHKDYSKAINIRLRVLDLNKKTGNKSGIMRMLMIVAETYAKVEKYDSAAAYWIRVINIKKEKGDTSYLHVYQNVGLACMNQEKWEEAIEYLQMGVTEGQHQNSQGYIGNSLQLIAQCYQKKRDFKNALETYEKALSKFQQLKNKYWQGAILNNIGNLYCIVRQDYLNAIRYELLSLEISESIKSKEMIAANENDLAMNYTRIRDYDKALDLLLKASVIFEELKAKEILIDVYRNTGTVYQLKGEKKKAEYYIQKSLQDTLSNNSTEKKVSHLNDFGLGYLKNEKPSEAFNLFQEALLLCRQSQDKSTTAMTLGNAALAYLAVIGKNELQKLPKNLQFSTTNAHLNYIISLIDSAIKLDTLIHDLNLLQAHYVILSTTYELKKDDKQALLYYKKYTFYKDSLFNGEKMKKIGRLESQLEINRKNAKIKQVEFENEVQRNRTKVISTILLSVLIIALVAFYFLNKRKKYKFQLKLLESELQVSDYERQVSDFKLQVSDVKQEALNAQMSDHFVSNAMHSIKGFIDNNDKGNAVLYLDRFRQLTREVIKNSQKKLITLKEDLDVLENFIELEKLRFTKDTFNYHIILHPDIDITNALLPPMVLQVLTENAIKHGFRKSLGGKLRIEILKSDNALQCIVQDNGIGRKAAGQTKREDTESFGTSLVERLVRISSNHSEKTSYKIIDLLDVDELSVGTRVEITLPYILNEENI